MWKTALKFVVFLLLRNRISDVKDEIGNNLSAVKESIAVMAESRAAIFKENFNSELQRLINSILGFMFILLAAVCAGLTGLMWLFAIAWSSLDRNIILGTAMILPILAGIGVYAFIRHSWKKEPLFDKTITQIENDWQLFRHGLDGTADTSEEANR